jgi:dUTP pyrophosphatase
MEISYMILNKKEIQEKIEEGMISNFIDIDFQLQANGFDLSLKNASLFKGTGTIDFDNKEREIPSSIVLRYNNDDEYFLQYGTYLIDFNESLIIPADIVAIGLTRSSLLRSGVYISSAVFDAGFRGNIQCVLAVSNLYGLRLKKNARLLQLIFFERRDDGSLYQGNYNKSLNLIKEIKGEING